MARSRVHDEQKEREESEMAVPKKRKSKAKKRSRRAANMNLRPRRTQECPNCLDRKLPHRACMTCGFYRGEQVVEVWETY